MTLYCSGSGEGAMLDHSDQYRGLGYSFGTKPKGEGATFYTEPSPDYIEEFFDQIEPETNRRYARGDLSAGGLSGGGYDYEYKGY